MSMQQRLADVKRKRAASVDMEGKPLPGYAERVTMIDREIAALESDIAFLEKKRG